MTGLEKMKSQILEEAKQTAESRRNEAEAKAKELVDAAKAEAQKETGSISQKSEAAVANLKERVISSNDLQRRTKLLAAKQEIIAEVLERAYASVKSMGDKEYFAMLYKLLEKYAQPEEGQMYLSAADLAKLPSGFEAKVKALAKEKGGSLAISSEGKNIENGFILAYGGIEENCTIKAMFDAKKDDLSDKVHRILF